MQKAVYEFISKQNNDPIIERRICRRTGEEFPIFQSERELLEKLSPTIGGKKYQLSLPTLSPKARQIKRLIRRNERRFYKSPSGVSTISPETGIQTMSQSDFFDFDHMNHGVEYSGDFGADIKKIFKAMPYPNRLTNNMENAEYCHQETDDKNCYLNAGGHFNENSMYNTYSLHGIRTLDNYRAFESEHVYQSIQVHKSQKVFFSQWIENSFNIRCSKDLKSCQNVLFGFGLNNTSYIYKNKVLPKEEWETVFQSYKTKIATNEGLEEVLKEQEEFLAKFPLKAINHTNCEHCIGNDLNNTKNIFLSTSGEESKDIIHANLFEYVTDCMDLESYARGQKCYNFNSSMQATDSIVGSQIFENLQNGIYTYFDKNSSFLLGCAGLNHKHHCIRNTHFCLYIHLTSLYGIWHK